MKSRLHSTQNITYRKVDRMLALVFVIILIWMGPAVKNAQHGNRHNVHTHIVQQFHISKLYSIQYISMRILGEKSTTIFLARYKYGNSKDKGIINVHVNIRSLKYKM